MKRRLYGFALKINNGSKQLVSLMYVKPDGYKFITSYAKAGTLEEKLVELFGESLGRG